MIREDQKKILWVNIIYIFAYGLFYISMKNYEFIIYLGVVLFFLGAILYSNEKVKFSNTVLWGLTVWGFMHLSGGAIPIGDGRLYELMIIPLSSVYPIFRFDQLVHMVGFGVATLVMYELLQPLLKEDKAWVRIGIIIVMAGLGAGALNEIIEFLAVVIVPETGVGGYINTSLDLVANLIGALIAFFVIKFRYKER
tara:strand:+ start:3815 stop:4402 length:588 start_codon:yes stop_codon:yes gene_type:complete